MGYSRYGSSGKGLSDRGYARYVSRRSKKGKHTVIKNPLSYLFGMAAIGTPVGWAGKRGYSGSMEQALVSAQAQHPGASLSQLLGTSGVQRVIHTERYGTSQHGAITSGRGGGYPAWVMDMMKGSELGLPPKVSGSSGVVLGAMIAAKVLL